MPDIDFFDFFRLGLGWVVTIYATIVTIQSLWGWYVWLAGSDKYIGLVRRYVIVQGLRLRFRAFMGDAIICILLSVAFLILWHAHHLIYDLDQKMQVLRKLEKHPLETTHSQTSQHPHEHAAVQSTQAS